MTTTENIRKELQTLADYKYQEFHSSLLPGANNILGDVYKRQTDMFGPIPYTKVLGDKTEGNGLSAPYDSQELCHILKQEKFKTDIYGKDSKKIDGFGR